MNYCILNGQMIPAKDACVPIHDRGFRFGDGAFETIPVQDGVPYQFDWHLSRLERGLREIRIVFDTASLRDACRKLLLKNQMQEGILRLQVTRGSGSRGYLPDPAHPQAGALHLIETAPMPVIPREPVALWQSRYRRVSAQALPVQFKLCQGLNSTLARMEAAEQHCADSLLLNERGQVCETSSGNIFWIKNKILFTPSLACGPLEGSTRAAVLRLSPLETQEVEAEIETLAAADAVFITNALWQAIPVNRLFPGEMQWDSAAAALRFRELLAADRQAYASQHGGFWR